MHLQNLIYMMYFNQKKKAKSSNLFKIMETHEKAVIKCRKNKSYCRKVTIELLKNYKYFRQKIFLNSK